MMPSSGKKKRVHELGQSIWLDFIDRKIMNTGELQRLIREEGIRGITSNPAIFGKSFADSNDYDEDIKAAVLTEIENEQVFYKMAVKDIQRAADLFQNTYEQNIGCADGYVSLEVSPRFANNPAKTIEQAHKLWDELARKNAMIKIPATEACISAIRHCISRGINVNVTLLFGLAKYREVAEAYISGLEKALQDNLKISKIASVASFFLSRIDSKVDPLLKEKGLNNAAGNTAVALAKQAYEIYKELFFSGRFKKLERLGATPQRLLWASTGTKDASMSDIKYIEELIGPCTVNTVPVDTLTAYVDHGNPSLTLEQGTAEAAGLLESVQNAGIDLDEIAAQLEKEGIEKFNEPYRKLMDTIQEMRTAAGANSGTNNAFATTADSVQQVHQNGEAVKEENHPVPPQSAADTRAERIKNEKADSSWTD